MMDGVYRKRYSCCSLHALCVRVPVSNARAQTRLRACAPRFDGLSCSVTGSSCMWTCAIRADSRSSRWWAIPSAGSRCSDSRVCRRSPIPPPRAEFVLAKYDSGDAVIPPMPFMFFLPGDTASHVAMTNELQVTINTVPPDTIEGHQRPQADHVASHCVGRCRDCMAGSSSLSWRSRISATGTGRNERPLTARTAYAAASAAGACDRDGRAGCPEGEEALAAGTGERILFRTDGDPPALFREPVHACRRSKRPRMRSWTGSASSARVPNSCTAPKPSCGRPIW